MPVLAKETLELLDKLGLETGGYSLGRSTQYDTDYTKHNHLGYKLTGRKVSH